MVTFRIDDVSPNTDLDDLEIQIKMLSKVSNHIILGVNLFGRSATNGAVYPDIPLRGHDRLYFYNIDRIFNFAALHKLRLLPHVEIVSHGLVHNIHSQMSRDQIEASILMSCSLLNAKAFIPPFNEISAEVVSVCERNDIRLIMNESDRQWRSIESEPFDPSTKFWYYHPWRINSDRLKEILS